MTPQQIDSLNNEAWALFEAGKRQSYKLAERALQASFKVEYEIGQAQSLTTLAMAYNEFHIEQSQSLQYALQALTLAEQLADWKIIDKSLYVIGSIHNEMGNHDEALSYFLRRLEGTSKYTELSYYRASALMNLGLVYHRMENYEKAIEVGEQALRLYRKKGSRSGELICLNNLCYDYYKLKRLAKAEQIGEEALALSRTLPDDVGTKVLILTKMGLLSLEAGQDDIAERYLLEAREEVEGQDTVYFHIRVHQRLGKLYTYQQRWEEAEEHLQTAVTLSLEGNHPYWASQGYEMLAELYQAQDRWQEAFYSYQTFHQLREKVFNTHSDRRFQALEVTYQTKVAQRAAEASKQRANELEKRVAERTADLQQANVQLNDARRIAEEANHAKSLFLANMSHELRTPLTAILLYTEFLLEMGEEIMQEMALKRLNRIHMAAKGLEGIITDLLDISKIETGKLKLAIHPAQVDDILLHVKNIVQPLADEKGIQLTFNAFSLQLETDPNRLRQILLNLLNNAIKFTNEGQVSFNMIQPDTQSILFCVSDTGIGIPENKLDAIFKPFVQVDPTHTRQYNGTGLGLAISHNLAKMMGGELNVESTLNMGSTFYVRLPLVYHSAP